MAIRSEKLNLLYTGNKIFKDKDILKKGHHPNSLDSIQHRDVFIEKYILYLRDLTNVSVPDNIFVYGAYGAGKTMLSTLVTLEVKNELIRTGKDVYIVYIYCETLKITSKIMKHINKELSNQLQLTYKLSGTSVADNFDLFYKLVNLSKYPVILIFDEIDKLVIADFINQLARIKECGFTKHNICIIGITNDTNFYNNLEGRTQSIIGQKELFIPPYNAEQLIDILKTRAEEAFYPNAYDEYIIQLCSAYAAQESGDARKAIDLLRVSGELAELRGSSSVLEEDVRLARDTLEINAQNAIVRDLPPQVKSVLLSILYKFKSDKNIYTKNIMDGYLTICKIITLTPVSYRRVSDYVKDLEELGFLSIVKKSKGKSKGVMNIVIPMIDIVSAKEAILQDSRFEMLKKQE